MKNLAFIMIVFFGCTVAGNQIDNQAIQNEYANYDPTVFPDRVMLSVPGDPATTRAVSWRTIYGDTVSTAEIAVANASPMFGESVKTVAGSFFPWEEESQSAMGHEVVFENLKPNTNYMYRVGDGKNWSEWFGFSTASDRSDPFSFLYFGDVQNDIRSLGSRTLRQAYSHFPDADFMLFAGDLVSRSQEEYWREFFYAGGWIFGMMPSLATPGNHEYDKPENQPRTFSKHWNQIYTFPSNSPSEKFQNRTYYLDYQGVRFISFDSPALGECPEDSTLLIGWLEKTLAENPHRWTIVFTHFPVYSCSQGRNNERYRDAVQPFLEKYDVDLVLTGHDHTYCRGFNPENIKVKGKNMPLYVVSVAGPKMYGLNVSFWSDRVGSMIQLYQHISIDQNQLEFQSFMVSGELYDHFVIRKDKNGLNTFIEGGEVAKIEQRTEIPESAREKYTDEDIRRYRQKFQVQ